MNLAPMPDHDRVNHPAWQALWLQYEAVTTPLRAAGLACDIEPCGGQTVIYVNLPDGTHLVIADADALPDRVADVTGWHVTRGHEDNPAVDGLVYDSTQDGDAAPHGAAIPPMLAAIAIHLNAARDIDTQAAGLVLAEALLSTPALYAVSYLGVSSRHTAAGRLTSEPFDSHQQAVKEYGFQTHQLQQDGWQMVHEQGGTQWPVTAWQRHEVLQVVFVTRFSIA